LKEGVNDKVNEIPIEFSINGQKRKVLVKPNDLLINIIRDELYLTGTKYGCGIGECGACTVFLDDEPVLSCLTLAAAVDGKEITTIEGLAKGNKLHPMQIAFLEKCGSTVRILHSRYDTYRGCST